MLKRTKPMNLLLNLIIITISIRSSYCYYCDHNFCDGASSYCCGDNVCCLYLNDHWTYYFSLTTIAFILTAFIWIVYHFMYRLVMLFCYSFINRNDDSNWWFKLMIQTDDSNWWFKLMIHTDDSNWWFKLMIQTDDSNERLQNV